MSFGIFNTYAHSGFFVAEGHLGLTRAEIRTHILADPTAFEEPLLETTIAIVIDDQGRLISTSHVGNSIAGSQDALLTCIASAKKRHISLRNHIQEL